MIVSLAKWPLKRQPKFSNVPPGAYCIECGFLQNLIHDNVHGCTIRYIIDAKHIKVGMM